MEEKLSEQIDALKVLKEFNVKLLRNIPVLRNELSGHRLKDTDKLLRSVVDAVNWEVQVMNGTMDVLNTSKRTIDTGIFNEKIMVLGSALKSGEDGEIATALEGLQGQFELLGAVTEEVLAEDANRVLTPMVQ
jgi:hypothetical protein